MISSWMVPHEARIALRAAVAKFMVENLGLEQKLLPAWRNTWSPRHLDPPLIEAAVVAMLTSMDMDVGGDFESYLVEAVTRYCRDLGFRAEIEGLVHEHEVAERAAWRKSQGWDE